MARNMTRSKPMARKTQSFRKPRSSGKPSSFITPEKVAHALKQIVSSASKTGKSFTSTGTTPAVYNTGGASHRPRKSFKRRKVKNITRSNLKGVSKKFRVKVEKVLNHSKVFGEFHYITSAQLRQTNAEAYSYVQADERGNPFMLWTPYQLWHEYSVLFNSKSANLIGNWAADITQGGFHNVSYRGKLTVQEAYAHIFFKSTSNHVVNIEMFECTPKKDTDNYPLTYMNDSVAQSIQANFTNSGGTIPLSPAIIGCPSSAFVELYKNFKVKIHTVKLLPGASSSIRIQGPKNATIDGSKLANEDTHNAADDILPDMSKMYNNKFLVFRVMNDISVSANTGKVIAWPSNNQGGVAMRMTRVTRFRPNSDLHSTDVDFQNTLWVQHVAAQGDGSADQQVTYENPISVASPL